VKVEPVGVELRVIDIVAAAECVVSLIDVAVRVTVAGVGMLPGAV